MSRYVYPAVFTPEDNGMYSVDFPDLDGCYTSGDDLADAIHMAEDVLAFTLYDLEKNHTNIPAPSENLEFPEGSFVNYITCDTLKYKEETVVK